MGLILHFP